MALQGKPVEVRDDLRLARSNTAGRITLDRPRRLNALTLTMVREIAATLIDWAAQPELRAIVIDGRGERGFCAGGDLVELVASARGDGSYARAFWADEYRLDAAIARYPKPTIALLPGIVMGGGVGIGAQARIRVVTPTTQIAMPEVGIGLIPDVGATWLFSRMPGEFGTYLALTGESIGAADAIALGLADAYVDDGWLASLVLALLVARYESGGDDVLDARAVVASFSRDPGTAPLLERRESIDAAFAFESVEEILEALLRDGSEFALAAKQRIESRSPTSLKLTLRGLRIARELDDLERCLQMEYRVMTRLLQAHDFAEGVRAAVIDKDRTPRWLPATLAGVSEATVAAHFVSLGADELVLAE